jgi:hypothetical protein
VVLGTEFDYETIEKQGLLDLGGMPATGKPVDRR